MTDESNQLGGELHELVDRELVKVDGDLPGQGAVGHRKVIQHADR